MRIWPAIAILVAGIGCGSEGRVGTGPEAGWKTTDCDVVANLRGLSVVNNRVAWASGSEGTFVRTVDGGQSWDIGTVPGAGDLDFRDIHAVSADRAAVISAGFPGKIFLTENGGATWVEVYSNDIEGVFFNSMAFWDEDHGIAVGDPIDGRFLLIQTEDGGRTWSELPFESRPEALPGEANFAASGTCISVLEGGFAWFGTGGPAARVFRSADWGLSWQVSETPLRSGKPSQGVFSVLFSNRLHGIVVGGDYLDEQNSTSSAAMTRDGGETWIPSDQGPTGFRECVTPVGADTDHLMTVGPTGADVSIDGGLSWKPVKGVGRMHSVEFSADGSLGIAVGAEGLIAAWNH